MRNLAARLDALEAQTRDTERRCVQVIVEKGEDVDAALRVAGHDPDSFGEDGLVIVRVIVDPPNREGETRH